MMIEKIKKSKNTKLILSIFVFSISGLFFVNSAPPPPGGNCKSCGSFESCYDGDSTLDSGWSDCEIVPGWPGCEVSGTYGSCQGGNT